MKIPRNMTRLSCPICGSGSKLKYRGLDDYLFGVPGAWDYLECRALDCNILYKDCLPDSKELITYYESYYTHEPRGSLFRRIKKKLYEFFRDRWVRENLTLSSDQSSYSVFPKIYSRVFSVIGIQSYFHSDYCYLDRTGSNSLLEIGCGDGSTLSLMKSIGWKVTGLDFDRKAVRRALEKGLDVRNISIEDFAERHEDSYDFIVAKHVVEHLRDSREFFYACSKLLHKDGRVLVVTPNKRSLAHLIFRSAWRGLEPPRHLSIFTREALHLLCHTSELEIERIYCTSNRAAPIWIASTKILLRSRNPAFKFLFTALNYPLAFAFGALENALVNLGFFCGEELVVLLKHKSLVKTHPL